MVAAGQQRLEDPPRFLAAADRREGIHIPKRADRERGRWLAEIVGSSVSAQIPVPAKVLRHRFDGRHEPRIRSLDDAEFVQQQNTGIDLFAAKAAYEAPSLCIPSAG